jgi:aspartyl-tRNA(Asn)/glutamyl-tRNA(Gln) amidotransferase subunit A
MQRSERTLSRRHFLAAASATTLLATPKILSAQAQPPVTGTLQTRAARDRLEEALARIADPHGEGARACLTVYSKAARAAADAADERARVGITLGPLDGAIVSIKDLFDVAGEPTRAGSKVLADATPAATDAPVVRRLRSAGAVIIAKTNMTEFAFSIVGINPHYGTPGNPADRSRVPGGSSSGGAVAVADGMCEIAIGTDTGGSIRVPAAFCGIVGFKPSKFRVPTEGAFPFGYTMDSVGPLARSVERCAATDAVISGADPWIVEPERLDGLRVGLPQGRLLTDLDQPTQAAFSGAVDELRRAGVRLTDEEIPLLDEMGKINAIAPITPTEAFAIHRDLVGARSSDYDPFVRARIEAASKISAADYLSAIRRRTVAVRAMDSRLFGLDGLVLPTSPFTPPTISEVSSSFENFMARATTGIRNTVFVNFFDLCGISLPLPRSSELPVGLMLVGRNGEDRKLLRMAAAIERLFSA